MIRSMAWLGASPLGVSGSTNCSPNNSTPVVPATLNTLELNFVITTLMFEDLINASTSFSCSRRRLVLLLVIHCLRSNTKVASATMTKIKRPPTTKTANMDWTTVLWEWKGDRKVKLRCWLSLQIFHFSSHIKHSLEARLGVSPNPPPERSFLLAMWQWCVMDISLMVFLVCSAWRTL